MLCCEFRHASSFITFPSFDTFSLQKCNNTPAVLREPSRSDLLAVENEPFGCQRLSSKDSIRESQ